MKADAVVIGAGFAGLSAAVRLADAGLSVVVLEESPRLGGRATAFTDRETGERIDNGQHVLFGCYRETYAFLGRIGTDYLAPLQPRLALTMAAADGQSFDLRCPSWSPPWHLVGAVLRWRALSTRDRLSALRIRGFLADVRRNGAVAVSSRVSPDLTVADWLQQLHQSPRLCDWLWYPLAIAALNQSPHVAAAAPFVRVVAEMFGPRVNDSAVGLPLVPLDDLFAVPSKKFIEVRGGAVFTKTPGRIVLTESGAVGAVRTDAAEIGEIETAQVVSAVPWHAFRRIWEAGVPPPLAGIAAAAGAMASSPIVTVNLWYDGRVMNGAFAGLVGGPMHWVFDKSAIFGERAGHLSVVASGADQLAAMDNAAIVRAVEEQLRAALPPVRSRRLLRSVVVREQRATFSLAPGGPLRPSHETTLAGFHLAGDWTDTSLPATIEGAVVSGNKAADAVLRARAGGPVQAS